MTTEANNQDLEIIYIEKELRELIMKSNDERYDLLMIEKRIEKLLIEYETLLTKYESVEERKGALTKEEIEEYSVKYFGLVELYAKKMRVDDHANLDYDEIFSAGQLGLLMGLRSYRKRNSSVDNLEGWLVTCIQNKIKDVYKLENRHRTEISLDEDVYGKDGDLSGDTMKNNLIADDKSSIDNLLENEILRDIISTTIEECLNDRERFIMIAYWGLGDKIPEMTQVEIAKALNIKQPAVARHISVSMEKVKEHLLKFYWQELQDEGFC